MHQIDKLHEPDSHNYCLNFGRENNTEHRQPHDTENTIYVKQPALSSSARLSKENFIPRNDLGQYLPASAPYV